MPFLTRAEKEKRVIELLELHKSTREIADEVHISFGDIGSIRRRHYGETEAQTKNKGEITLSTDTQVFKMFEEPKTPVQVAIELNLKSNEVGRLYKEWWQLKGLHQLNQLYEQIGDDIFQFHSTYKYIKDRGYTPHQLIDVANHLGQLPLLRSEREQLKQEIQNLVDQRDQLNESIEVAKQDVSAINVGIRVNSQELERLNNQKQQIQSIIAGMQASAGYKQIQRIAEASARDILTDNMVVLGAALRAMLQSLSEEPSHQLQTIIYGSLSYPLYEPGNGKMPQNYLQLRQAILLQAAEEMYKDLVAKVVNTTMSSALYTKSGSGYPLNWSDNRYRQQ
jgi:hypothetical protein